MMRDGRAEELAWLAAELSDPRGRVATTQVIADRALTTIDSATHASVTVRARRSLATLSATSVLASELDRSQSELGEGPAVDGGPGAWSRSGDVGHDKRWPRWGPYAADRGAGSLLSLPLRSKGRTFGSLNLYADRSGAFSERDEVDLASLFAVHATSALVAARLVEDLETAMVSRHEIGLAQGILMGRYGVSVEVAFSALRRVSRHDNRKLRDVARDVIRTGGLAGAPGGTLAEDDDGPDGPDDPGGPAGSGGDGESV